MSHLEPSPTDRSDELSHEEMIAEMIANVTGQYVVIGDPLSAAESGRGIVFDTVRDGWIGIDGRAAAHENLIKKMVAAGTKVFDSLEALEAARKAEG